MVQVLLIACNWQLYTPYFPLDNLPGTISTLHNFSGTVPTHHNYLSENLPHDKLRIVQGGKSCPGGKYLWVNCPRDVIWDGGIVLVGSVWEELLHENRNIML